MKLALIFASCLAVGAAASASAPKCQSHIDPDGPRVTSVFHRGRAIPLATPVLKEMETAEGGEKILFRMPVGYNTAWLNYHKGRDVGPTTIIRGNGWTFWMPEGRFPEVNARDVWYQCEQGRPPPTADQFLVSVGVRPLYKYEGVFRKSRSEGTPEERWRKYFKSPETDIVMSTGLVTVNRSNQPYREPASLGEIRPERYPIGDGDVYYRHPDGHPFQFFLHCNGIMKPGVCVNQFYFPDKNLNLEVRFTRDHLDKWQDVIDMTMELLDSWRVAPAFEVDQ